MKLSPTANPLLLLSALFTWAVVGIQGLAEMKPLAERLGEPLTLVWLLAYLIFGATFWLNVRDPEHQIVGKLVIETLSALIVIGLGDSGVEGSLLAIISAQVPMFLPLRAVMLWCTGLFLSSLVVFLLRYPPLSALTTAISYLGFLLFTATASHIQQRALHGRRKLSRLHARLKATQALLAEREREQERLRIARELHDSLGHHLMALSLNIEAASHCVQGSGLEHVNQARGITHKLLGEVRQVVSAMRERPIDLESSLREMIREVPGLAVHLRMPDGLVVPEPAVAHCLLRCAQEVITNTLRHARARHLWIDVVFSGDGVLRLHAWDDGVGAVRLEPGAGLTGMLERFTQLGGSLEWRLAKQRGLELLAWLPTRGVRT